MVFGWSRVKKQGMFEKFFRESVCVLNHSNSLDSFLDSKELLSLYDVVFIGSI